MKPEEPSLDARMARAFDRLHALTDAPWKRIHDWIRDLQTMCAAMGVLVLVGVVITDLPLAVVGVGNLCVATVLMLASHAVRWHRGRIVEGVTMRVIWATRCPCEKCKALLGGAP